LAAVRTARGNDPEHPDLDTLRRLVSSDAEKAALLAMLLVQGTDAGPELNQILTAIRQGSWSTIDLAERRAQSTFVVSVYLLAEDPVWDQVKDQIPGALASVRSPVHDLTREPTGLAKEIQRVIETNEIQSLSKEERLALLLQLPDWGMQE
jgi:hypothetical protein